MTSAEATRWVIVQGVPLPTPVRTTYRPVSPEADRLPYEVTVTAEVVGERYEITEVIVRRAEGGPVIDSAAFRGLPLLDLVAQASATYATLPTKGDDPDQSDLRLVAQTYAVAHATRIPPTKAVAARLGISHPLAAKRVRQAREAGYLSPTTKGKAGV